MELPQIEVKTFDAIIRNGIVLHFREMLPGEMGLSLEIRNASKNKDDIAFIDLSKKLIVRLLYGYDSEEAKKIELADSLRIEDITTILEELNRLETTEPETDKKKVS